MADGFYGLLDFVGESVGQPEFVTPPTPALPVGFYGIVDFTGIPTGQPAEVKARGGATWAVGRRNRLIQMLLLEQREREMEEAARRRRVKFEAECKAREEQFQDEILHRQRLLTTMATYTTLFAEL